MPAFTYLDIFAIVIDEFPLTKRVSYLNVYKL